MRILDIDLDFFLNKVQFWPGFGRPADPELHPWPPHKVRDFLEHRCGLRRDRPLPGLIVEEHHEIFFDWRRRIQEGRLQPPFEVVHIDAHADLGFGDASVPYVVTELLSLPLKTRAFPRVGGREGLGPGNYLLFAIACRWISRLTYVYHPGRYPDLPEHIVKLDARGEGIIQLPWYGWRSPETLQRHWPDKPLALEPPVLYREVSGSTLQHLEGPFDLLYIARSPAYTPAEADRLLEVFCEYIKAPAVHPPYMTNQPGALTV
ncbi:MAG: UPF0489 family protein [Rhodothermus sp.]|nr:UPF0489 family protein [Rhodothermus sp.]